MDLFATIFGLILLALSVGVTYHWGIKPDREKKKRRAEQTRAELRRRHSEKLRRGAALAARVDCKPLVMARKSSRLTSLPFHTSSAKALARCEQGPAKNFLLDASGE
jgi:hypothetical protein